MITTDALSLRLPGGMSFDLMHYWDGQPVRFVCRRRKGATAYFGSGFGSCSGSEDGRDVDAGDRYGDRDGDREDGDEQ